MTTREELVEAMARAMCVYQDQDPDRVLESMDKHRRPVIMWTHWKGEADAALSVLRQWLADQGLVVVPRLPSWEMLEAGHVSLVVDPWDATSAPWVGAAWECMIAAAPDALRAQGESS